VRLDFACAAELAQRKAEGARRDLGHCGCAVMWTRMSQRGHETVVAM
jgi:hypothetical protein